MPTDPLTEKMITPRQYVELPHARQADGRAGHLSKFFRHAKGVRRRSDGMLVCLETVDTPGGMRTTEEAVRRFLAKLNDRHVPKRLTQQAADDKREIHSRELAAAGWA